MEDQKGKVVLSDEDFNMLIKWLALIRDTVIDRNRSPILAIDGLFNVEKWLTTYKEKTRIFIYQMPAKLGGDWAASSNGIISDGFKSEKDAEEWALEQF
jgi:hypothetical protein